jgi:hypothetical protein
MAIPRIQDSVDQSPSITTGRGLARLGWHAIRLPILATLAVLEPVVRTLLSGLALLGILMALFFEYLIRLPNFPFWLMIGLSIGCALLLTAYYSLMRLFANS